MKATKSMGLAFSLVFSSMAADPAEPVVVERGAHHRTVQMIEELPGEDQAVTMVTNTIIEIGTGMHVFSETQNAWVEASPRIRLENGRGRVDGTQHKATFSGNINDPQGAVEFETPEGQKVRIRTHGLIYTDPASGDSVLFAPIKTAQGQTDENFTVLYENAFQGVKADIRIRSLLAGVESDVILREMLPPPSAFGLANETARLEVLHEIIEGPQPGLRLGQIRRNNGQLDPDHTLDFGSMSISLGNAFSLPPPGEGAAHRRLDGVILVSKEHFEMDGRKYFVESVPFSESAAIMNGLVPEREEAFNEPRQERASRKLIAKAAAARATENSGTGLASVKPRELAIATGLGTERRAGFVIDWASLVNQANFTFNGASTYLVVTNVNLTGVTTIEGGTVVKFTTNNFGSVTIDGTVVCKTEMYLPAVFTGRFDAVHGETVLPNGSSANTFANHALKFSGAGPHQVSNLVFKHANEGLVFATGTGHIVQNVQFYDCARPIKTTGASVSVRNALFHKTRNYAVTATSSGVIAGENWTVHEAPALFENLGTATLTLKNSILAAVANQNGFLGDPTYNSIGQPSTIFTSGGTRGAHYLANDSLRNKGTTTIDGGAELKKLTTHPPQNITTPFAVSTTLSPRVPIDNDVPDLGYHYAPIDYCFGNLALSAPLILTNGVRVAIHSDKAVTLGTNGKIVSEGKPNRLNRIFRYSNVQEQPATFGNGLRGSFVHLSTQYNNEVRMSFTELPVMAGSATTTALLSGFGGFNVTLAPLALSDCLIKGATISLATWQYGTTVSLTNNAFVNSRVYFEQGPAMYNPYQPMNLTMHNNLFHRGCTNTFIYNSAYAGSSPWTIRDNFFNSASLTTTFNYAFNSGYNAFRTGLTAFGTGGGNQTGISADFVTGPLGDLYYSSSAIHPSSGYLRDRGSRSAGSAGLAHHGTHSNGGKESGTVDIGFHYIASDTQGNPADADLDRLPDYWEDYDRDGNAETGELSFNNADTDGDGSTDLEELRLETNPLTHEFRPRRLAVWSFSEEELPNSRGELPTNETGVEGAEPAAQFSGGAVKVTTSLSVPQGAVLSYKEIGEDGLQNFARTNGTIRFWFRPEWLANAAPANGKLIHAADSATTLTNWWSLEVQNANLKLLSRVSPAAETTHFTIPLGTTWSATKWHHIALTYETGGVKLYVDGVFQPATTGATWTGTTPASSAYAIRLASLLTFGNARGAGASAKGYFDEIETFNYPLSAERLLVDYRASSHLDDDNDGLSNIDEISVSFSDPLDWDSDDDGMSDGWEHHQNLRRPAGLTAFDLDEPGPTDADKNFEPSGESDGRENLDEYLSGLDPYRRDDPPLPSRPNVPLVLSDLISIKFGGTYSGQAAAGTGTPHTWNSISALASEVSLLNASGGASGAKVSLLMNLGHGTRFTVTCSTPVQEAHYCAWLGITNSWANVFCCKNDSPSPETEAHYFCLHSDTGEPLILSEERNLEPTNFDWNLFHYYHSNNGWGGRDEPINSELVPLSPWRTRNPLYRHSGWWHPFWGLRAVTPLASLILPASEFTREPGAPPPPAVPQSSIQQLIVQSLRPEMEAAWTSGFDQSGTHTGGGLAGAGGLLNTHLWNSLDLQLNQQPQSVECGDFWFTRDGHGVIKIGPLPRAQYRVYLYGAKPDVPSTKATVNGAAVSIPGSGATMTSWELGANYETVTVRPNSDGFIEVHFESGKSLISAIQLLKLPPFVEMGEVSATVDDFYGGVKVTWPSTPTVSAWNIYRQVGIGSGINYRATMPDRFLRTMRTQTTYVDPFESLPMGVPIRYLVQAVDDFGQVLDYDFSETLTVATTVVSEFNHAPRLHQVRTMRHTYKDTPYVLSPGRLRQFSDASDFDGDPIFFEIVSIISGSIIIDDGVNPPTTVAAAGTSLQNPIAIDGSRTISWQPAAGRTGRSIPAFEVRATDGAFRSLTIAKVEVEVRDDSVLAWWGEWKHGRMGDGQEREESEFEVTRPKYPRREEQNFSIDPAALLIDPDELQPPRTDRRMVNPLGMAIGHPNTTETRAALTVQGEVWTWGSGRFGTLGNGVTTSSGVGNLLRPQINATRPVKVDNLVGAVQVAAGERHMLALKSDGSVWAWGAGDDGALGVDPYRLTQYYFSHGYSSGGCACTGGASSHGEQLHTIRASVLPRRIEHLRNIVSIAAVGRCSFAIDDNGELRAWGVTSPNDFRADPEVILVPGKVIQVVGEALYPYYLALNDLGEVYGWGNLGAIHPGFAANSPYVTTPTKLPVDSVASIATARGHTVVVTLDGAVRQWGRLDIVNGPTVIMPVQTVGTLRNIVKVATSGAAALALDIDGNVFGWGRATWGVLGNRVDISDADWTRLNQYWAASLHSQADALVRTPAFGYYEQPILLDNVDMADDIAIAIDGAYASTASLGMGPGGFAARAMNGSVELSWRGVAGASAYELSRRPKDRNWEVIANIPHDSRMERITWTDLSVVNGSLYEYRIRAITDGAYGEYSRSAEAWPNFPPNQVTGLTLYPTHRQIQLVWNVEGRGLGYEIWRRVGTSGDFVHFTNLFNVNPGTVTLCDSTTRDGAIELHDLHLNATELHSYRVRAVNQVGVGPFSTDVSATPSQAAALPAPTLTFVPIGNYEAKVTWPSRADMHSSAQYLVELCELIPKRNNEGGLLDPAEYIVASRMVVGSPRDPQPLGTANEATLPVTEGRKYRVIVTEFNLCQGEGNPSEEVDFATGRSLTLPANPIEGFGVIVGPRSFHASWRGQAVSYMAKLSKRTGTNPETWTQVNECQPLLQEIEPDETGFAQFMQGGLDPAGGTYKLELFTLWETYAPAVASLTHEFTVPAVPALPAEEPLLPGVVARPANNRIRITWWGPDDATAMDTVSLYKDWHFILHRGKDSTTEDCLYKWSVVYEGPQFGVDDEEVVNGTAYKYRLFGISPGANPEVRWFETAAVTPASTFANIQLGFDSDNLNGAVKLTWNQITHPPGLNVTYEIMRADFESAPYRAIASVAGGVPREYIDREVVNGQRYFYRLHLTCSNGDAFETETEVGEPSDAAPFLAPGPFSANVEGGMVMISWPDVPGADRYDARLTSAATPTRIETPNYSVSLVAGQASGNSWNSHFIVSATGRGASSTAYPTVVAWNESPSSPIRYSIRQAGVEVASYVKALNERSPFATVILRPGAATINYTVHAIYPTSESAAPAPTTSNGTAPDIGLQFSLPNDAGITSPTNIVVAVAIANPEMIGQAVYYMQYFDNGVLIETDTEPPYQFEWSNPAGSVDGIPHTLQARMVTQDWAKDATISVTVKIRPDLLAFQTAETDLQLSTPGLPLSAARSYDSRDLSGGLLGLGWKFDWEQAGMSVPDLAKGWGKIGIHFRRGFQAGLEESVPHTIDVRLAGGALNRFRPVAGPLLAAGTQEFETLTGETGIWVDSETTSLGFVPLPGYSGGLDELYNGRIGSINVAVEDRGTIVVSRLGLNDGTIPIQSFIYTADGGAKYYFGSPTAPLNDGLPWTLRLENISDAAGNSITKTPLTGENFRLDHSNKRSLIFQKSLIGAGPNYQWTVHDPLGLDGSGNPTGAAALKYTVAMTNTGTGTFPLLLQVDRLVKRSPTAVYESTTYQYDSGNRLLRVIAHDGVILLENAYEAATGLLTSQKDSMGVAAVAGQPTFNSTTGETTVPISDTSGVPGTAAVIYGPGGEVVETQAVANTRGPRMIYDLQGRPLYSIAPGLTAQNGEALPEAYSHFYYDRAGRLTATTDGLGNQASIAYDDEGNPVATEDALGFVTGYTYYEGPADDDVQPPTNYNTEYNAEGMLRSSTDAEGTTTVYTYNRNGQVLTEKRIPPGGGAPAVTTYKYEENVPFEGFLKRVYEPEWNGDPNSLLYATEYEYDMNGNRTVERRWRTVVTRDGNGAVISQNAVEEIVTRFTYDARNRLIETENALLKKSGSTFNIHGKVAQSYNTLGQPTAYRFDPRGNLIETTYPNGTVSRIAYDGRGRTEWTQDACVPSGSATGPTTGPATKTFYDTQGRVIGTRRYADTIITLNDVVPINESQTGTINDNIRVLSGFPNPGYKRTVATAGTAGPSSRTQFDAAGRVKFSVDPAGGLTEFVYDAIGRKTSVKRYPDYVASSDPTSADLSSPTGTPVSETKFAYDANGNQISVTDALKRVIYYDYDRLNRQRVVTYPLVSTEGRLTFEQTDVRDWIGFINHLRTATDPVKAFIWEGIASWDQDFIETADLTTSDLEEVRGLLTTRLQSIVSGPCIWTEMRFAGVDVSWFTHDARIIWETEATPERAKALNRLLLADAYAAYFDPPISPTWNNKQQITTYDGLGRRIAETDEARVHTLFAYDKLGRLTEVINDFKPGGYDQGERPVVTRYQYDEVGNLRKEIKVEYQTSNGQLVLDTNKRPIELLTQPATTIYEYDKLGRRTHRFLPGVQSFTDIGVNAYMEKVTYADLPVGTTFPKLHQKVVQDFRGETVTFDYDSMDRLEKRTLSDVAGEGSRTITYVYSGPFLNQVSDVGASTRVTHFDYDGFRRLRKKDTPEGVLAYTYDLRGSVKRMKAYHRNVLAVDAEPIETTPTTADTEYGYDGMGRLKTVTNHRLTGANISTYTYDPAGSLRQLDYPNFVRHSYGYTEQSRLASVQVDKTSTTAALLRRFAYTLDASGHRTSMAESDENPQNARTVQYAYDYAQPLPTVATVNGQPIQPALPRLNRLTKETINPGANQKVLDYHHDLRGNRLNRTVTGTGLPPAQQLTYDANDEMTLPGTPPVQFTYDDNGNTRISPTQANATISNTDSYDAENRLIKRVGAGTTTNFGYAHDGHRVSRTIVGGQTTYFLVDEINPTGYAQVVAEFKVTSPTPTPSAAAFHQAYEYGLRIISQHQGTLPTQRQYYAHDGLGSTRFITDSTGAAPSNALFDYDAYGNLMSAPTTTLDIHFLFAGEQWDSTLGMYYNRARYFSPGHGRFWNRDSYEGSTSEPGSLHKYMYCAADPVNRMDPSGNESLIGVSMAATIGNSLHSIYDGVISGVGNSMRATLFGIQAGRGVNDILGGFVLEETGIGAIIDLYQGVRNYFSPGDPRGHQAAQMVEFYQHFDAYPLPFLMGIENGLEEINEVFSSPRCLVAGTLVETESGLRGIETIRKGDLVWAWNGEAEQRELKKVLNTFTNRQTELAMIEVGDVVVIATLEHPFYTQGKAWKQAGQLKEGELLFDPENSEGRAIRRIIRKSEVTAVYNMEVEGLHNYFVTTEGILTHNTVAGFNHFFQRAFRPVIGYGERALKAGRYLDAIAHTKLHQDLNLWLQNYRSRAGVPMNLMPRRGVPGTRITSTYGFSTVEQAMREFYQAKYPHYLSLFEEEVKAIKAGLTAIP